MLVDISSKDPQTVENLGGKGFGLWQMTQDGLPVPPALVIPTTVCVEYMQDPSKVMKKLDKNLPAIRKHFMDAFGYMPLLSVRSGARVSMPGMMDTILNVGLDDSTVADWDARIGSDCTTDSYARLIEMYGSVVSNIERSEFEGLSLEQRRELFQQLDGADFPNADEQILNSIEAVFNSWNNERAVTYRKMYGIPNEWGTAVVLQAMVFGNLNGQSATGVLFTRNPDNGLAKIDGEFLVNAQGEDVVAGIKTPLKLEAMNDWNPEVHQELCKVVLELEQKRKDVQDVEFTIQDGKLYILQTRNAKRSAPAAVKIALDMHSEGVLTRKEAIARVSRAQYALLQQPVLDPKFNKKHDWKGIPACSGVATGVIVTSAAAAINCKEPCILVTQETTPDDIGGMIAAMGVVTMHGGSTSHAAVVARGMNKPCIVGVGANLAAFDAGQKISIDGATGRIWNGEVPVIDNSKSEELGYLNDLMHEEMGCHLISDDPKTNCKVLDVTAHLMNGAELVKLVKARLANSQSDFVVDMALYEGCPEFQFYRTFCDPAVLESAAAGALCMLSPDERKRFSVLTSNQKVNGLNLIVTVSTLEELVLAKGSFVLSSQQMTDAMKKVVAWKAAEGGVPMTFGKKTEGDSYLSQEQVVAELLQ